MSPHLEGLKPETTIGKAVTRFLTENVEVLPVINETKKLVGLVGESDMLAAVADEQRRQDPVSLYMLRDFVSIDADAPMETVIDQLILHRVRCLPVMSSGQIVGMIERREVLRFLSHDATSIFSIG